MLISFFRWIFGYVTFDVIGKYPERFINIVTKNRLAIWNTTKLNGTLSAQMYVKDYRNIRILCRKSSVRLKIKSRHGLPFCIRKYKPRVGVVAGIVVFVAVVWFMSCFVWTIEITGLETISHSELMRALKENGLSIGTYKVGKSFQTIARDTMLDVDKIGWMAINVTGSHASVELKEKALSPHVEDTSVPANIKAKCDGLIKSIDVRMGKSYFEAGSAVVKDQLIVSAVVEDKRQGVRLVRADADVIAYTNEKKTFCVNKNQSVCVFEKRKYRKTIDIVKTSFLIKSAFLDTDNCMVRYNKSNLCVNGYYLPVGISEQRLYEKQFKNVTFSNKQAEMILKKQQMLYRCFALKDAKITEAVCEYRENSDSFMCSVTYSCEKNIAYKQEIDAKDLTIQRIIEEKKEGT